MDYGCGEEPYRVREVPQLLTRCTVEQMHPQTPTSPNRTSSLASTPWPNMKHPCETEPSTRRSNRARRVARTDALWNLCRGTLDLDVFGQRKSMGETRLAGKLSLVRFTDTSVHPRCLLGDIYQVVTRHAWDSQDRFQATWRLLIVPTRALHTDRFQTHQSCVIACVSTNSRLPFVHFIRLDARWRFPLPSPLHRKVPCTHLLVR